MGKKKKKSKRSVKISFGINNTIMITVMLTIVLMVGVFESFMYVYTRDSIRDIDKNISSEFVNNIKTFNIDLYTKNYSQIKEHLNEILMDDLKIKHIVVTDSSGNELYSTLPKGTEYIYSIPDNLSTFKLKNANFSNYKIVYINKFNSNVYLLVPNESGILYKQVADNMMVFFGIILLLCLCVSYILARSISKPLLKMQKTVSQVAKGDLSVRLDNTKYNEINELISSFNMMTNALQRLYSSLEVKVQDRTKELKNAYAELQNTQAMMVHSEKMKSLGELVAGIMHEINNPINFIYGNMTHLGNYSSDLMDIIEQYTSYDGSLKPEEKSEIDKKKEEIDYEFLKSDMPDLIKSCKEGAERAKNIIQDLKSFSRMEEVAITYVDIAHEMDMTLNILHNKLKNKAEIHKEYPNDLPRIEAFGGQLNQVFMNILDNAAGAIEDKGDIWIRLKPDEAAKKFIIEIEDNGMGMDEETARKVFNPFFTTKPVGQGTGLGMSITYKIIKNHQGDIRVESKKNEGTKFIITLPLTIDRESLNTNLVAGGNNG